MSADLLMLGMAFTVVKTWVDETIKKRKRQTRKDPEED